MFTQDQRLAMTPLLMTINACSDEDKAGLLQRYVEGYEATEAWALDYVQGNHSLALLPSSLRTDAVVDAALERHIGQARFLAPSYIENREGFFLRHSIDRFTLTGEEPWLENPDVLFEAMWGLLAASKTGYCPLKNGRVALQALQPFCAPPPEIDTAEYLWLMLYLHGDYHWREGEAFGMTRAQHDAAILEQWAKGTGAIGSWRSGQVFQYLSRMDGGIATKLLRTRMDITGQGAYFAKPAGVLFLSMLQEPENGKVQVSWPLVLGFVAASLDYPEDLFLLLEEAQAGGVACASCAEELLRLLVESSGGRSLLRHVTVQDADGNSSSTWEVDLEQRVAQVPLDVAERLLDEHPASNLYCAPLDVPFAELFNGEADGTPWDDLLFSVYTDRTPR